MNMPERNYYEILRVNIDASQDEIKKARNRQLEFHHPDRFDGDKKPDLFRLAEEETKLINIAYDVLSDPEKRAEYDEEKGLKAEPPCPVIIPDRVTFKETEIGVKRHCILKIDNVGGPFNELRITDESSSQRPEHWLKIAGYDDSKLPIEVVIEAKGSKENTDYSGYIFVKMDGVEKRAPFKMHTVEQSAEDEVLSSSAGTVSPSKRPQVTQTPSYSPATSYARYSSKKPWKGILIATSIIFLIVIFAATRSSNPPTKTVYSTSQDLESIKSSLTGKIVFTKHNEPGDNSYLYLTNAGGSDLHKIAEDGSGIVYVDISADGSKILMNDQIINPDGRVISTLSTPDVYWTKRLSPNGSRIIYRAKKYGEQPDGGVNSELLFIMNLDGSDQRSISKSCRGACWSPDGSKIACIVRNELVIMDLNGSRLQATELYPKDRDLDWNLDWSPDGSKILLTEYHHSDYSRIVSLTDLSISDIKELICKDACWSPDSKFIAFCDFGDSNIGLFDPSTRKAFATLVQSSEKEAVRFAWSKQ